MSSLHGRRGGHHGQSQLLGLSGIVETGLEHLDTLLLGPVRDRHVAQVRCQDIELRLYPVMAGVFEGAGFRIAVGIGHAVLPCEKQHSMPAGG